MKKKYKKLKLILLKHCKCEKHELRVFFVSINPRNNNNNKKKVIVLFFTAIAAVIASVFI